MLYTFTFVEQVPSISDLKTYRHSAFLIYNCKPVYKEDLDFPFYFIYLIFFVFLLFMFLKILAFQASLKFEYKIKGMFMYVNAKLYGKFLT